MMKNIQTGRSMIEMLGVIAIIGLLSMGAITGYQYAMNKYKAATTLEEITRRNVILTTQYKNHDKLDMSEFPKMTFLGYPVYCQEKEADYGHYSITIEDVPKGVCHQIVHSNYPSLLVLNDQYSGDNIYECQEANKVEFIFDEQNAWCEKTGDNGACCDSAGRCCPKNKPLMTSEGQCMSCNAKQPIHLGENIDMCARCSNRQLVGEYCAEPCPPDQFRRTDATCLPLNQIRADQYLYMSFENIEKVLTSANWVIGGSTASLVAAHCDFERQTLDVASYPETCAKCRNRKLVGNDCVLR